MSQREWVAMCKEAKIAVSIGELNECMNRVDRPTEEQKLKALIGQVLLEKHAPRIHAP